MDFYGILMKGDFETDNIKAKDGTGITLYNDAGQQVFKIEDGGTITPSAGASVNEFSTDGTMVDNSDLALPTEKAVKTYVDSQFPITHDQVSDWDEGVQDTIGATLSGGSGIDFMYNDTAGVIAASAALSPDTGVTITPNGRTTIGLDLTSDPGITISDDGTSKKFSTNFNAGLGLTIATSGSAKAFTLDSPTITLSGDVTGSAVLDRLQDMNMTTTIVNPAVPTGTKMLFVQASAPTGWTKLTTYTDKAVIILNSNADGDTLQSGGSRDVTASHNHSVSQGSLRTDRQSSHSHGVSTGTVMDYNLSGGTAKRFVLSIHSAGSHTHGIEGGGVSAAVAQAVKYQQVIIAQKN